MSEEQKENTTNSEETQSESHNLKTMEKIWGATVDTWHQATFSAGKYSRVVQKKIDLNSVHKKISTAHGDLGRTIDELHQSGEQQVMEHSDVREMLERLTGLRATAATMEEEIAAIRSQEIAEEEMHHREGGNA